MSAERYAGLEERSSPDVVEPVIGRAFARPVGSSGRRWLQAAGADTAIQMLERDFDIRLLFTDIDMPGSMKGLTLAAAVRRRWPPVGNQRKS